MLHYYYRKVPVQSTGTSYNQGNMYCCQLRKVYYFFLKSNRNVKLFHKSFKYL